jgi:hypothetical protein
MNTCLAAAVAGTAAMTVLMAEAMRFLCGTGMVEDSVDGTEITT